LVLVESIIQKWAIQQLDVEVAFLYGDLNEDLFMRVPQGMNGEGKCLKLKKSIYGLVQAARSWWEKLTTYLEHELKFEKCRSDACLLKKREESDICFLAIYVDDGVVTGTMSLVQSTIAKLGEVFSIKVIGELNEYVGCVFKFLPDGTLLISQPKILNKIEREFASLKLYDTPAAPGQILVKAPDDDFVLGEDDHKIYRSGVGTLLYLVKKSRADITNVVRELSTHMDEPMEAHLKSLRRTLGYVLNSKDKVLRLKPTEANVLYGYVDSDYASCKDTRRSITGYAIFFRDCLVDWKSKQQGHVTLSSTEAEYTALSGLIQGILFTKQVLEFMEVPLELPIKVFVDNTGAIFMAKNWTSGQRTKHVDVKYHFVRELIFDGMIEVTFVRTDENIADVFTKNLGREKFVRFIDKLGIQAISG
jgi:hypothetical protein